MAQLDGRNTMKLFLLQYEGGVAKNVQHGDPVAESPSEGAFDLSEKRLRLRNSVSLRE